MHYTTARIKSKCYSRNYLDLSPVLNNGAKKKTAVYFSLKKIFPILKFLDDVCFQLSVISCGRI